MALDFIFKRCFLARFYVHLHLYVALKLCLIDLREVYRKRKILGENGISRLNVGKFLIDKKIV